MTYQIHRYPADLIDVVRVRGQRVVIRPVLPQDRDLTADFFGGLSPASRYARFLSPMRALPQSLLERFTHIDYSAHVALVAEVFADGRETVIAEARYARLDDGESAEFAVSVAEDWQGAGLARLLLDKLECRAATAGIKRLTGETLSGNDRMIRFAKNAGFSVRRSLDTRGVMRLEKVLEAAPWRGSCAEAGRTSAAA